MTVHSWYVRPGSAAGRSAPTNIAWFNDFDTTNVAGVPSFSETGYVRTSGALSSRLAADAPATATC